MKYTTTYGNNDKLTENINRCAEPRRVLTLLALLVEPGPNQRNNTRKKF